MNGTLIVDHNTSNIDMAQDASGNNDIDITQDASSNGDAAQDGLGNPNLSPHPSPKALLNPSVKDLKLAFTSLLQGQK